jgi:hypothetical protein
MMIDFDNIESLTKDQILSCDMIDELYDFEDRVERQTIIFKVEERAKVLGALGKFQTLIKEHERQLREERAELKKSEATSVEIVGNKSDFQLDTGEIIPIQTGRWYLDSKGVYAYQGLMTIIASHYPIIITQRFSDRETGREEVEVAWRKDFKYRSITVGRSVISSNSKIVALSDYGFPVTSETSKALVSYLADFEKLNSDFIKERISTSKLGWAGMEFMPYSDGDITYNVPPAFKALTGAVKESGEFEIWLDTVKTIRQKKRPEPLLYMAASFGSILVPIINISPFIVNLYGTTGKGKTVNLMLASSIWANPTKFITESTSTLNSLEQRLNILNNLPMMIDDLSKIKDRGDGDKLTEMIYMLCSGQGKGRLNKNIEMRETATWSNAILTNIERPLATETMQGGAVNRVLDFEIQEGMIFDDCNGLVNIIKENYGFAGEKFVEVVRANINEAKELVNRFETEIKRIAKDTGHEKEQKQVTPMAILLAADALAEKYIFKDGAKLDVKYCISCLKDVQSVSEMERALNHVKDDISINRMNYVPDGQDGNYRGKVYGFIEGDYVYMVGAALEQMAKTYNFNANQFLKWCQTKGKLMSGSDRLSIRRTNPCTKERKLYYALKIIENDEKEDPKDGGFE